MANNSEAAAITRIKWQPRHDDYLSIAAGTKKDLQIVREQVKKEIAVLWECRYKKKMAHVVTRMDLDDELCIVLFQGSGLLLFGKMIYDAAKKEGLKVRAHVKRKGMVRQLEKLGLKISETVLKG